MADIQKPDMTKQWASGGDKTPPSDALLASGWNSGDIPSNTDFNYIDARQDQGLAYLLQKGVPEWDSGTEYQANKSYVQYGGKVYKCIQTGTNKQPDTQLSYWRDEQGVSPSRTIMSFDGTGVADGSLLIFAGRDTIGDGGGGHLRFLAGSTATANGVTIYAVTGGRLVREGWSVFGINVLWAGAKRDGVTDDTAAIQAAFSCAATSKAAVYIPGTTASYKITDNITVPDGVVASGDGWWSLIKQVSLNKDVFTAGNSNTFRNLRLKTANGDDSAFVNCIYASNVSNLTVENCFLEPGDLGGCGVHMRGVKNSQIRGNRIYGGKWTSGVGPSATASDILLYSFSSSERHIITGNQCLSNNSQGIFIDAIGYDGDILVANNICVTLDPDTCTVAGDWSLAASGGVRRHGIVAGYNSTSVSGPRVIIDGNICRNTRWTGIYKQGASSGAVVISNNLCDRNGYEIGATLAGGIYLTQSGYELVTGNEITNFQNTTTGDTGAMTVASASAVTAASEIRGNKIVGSAGYGLVLKTQSAYVNVDSNSFSGCTNADIAMLPSPGLANVGGHRITNNVITRNTATLKPAISLSIQSSTLYTSVKNNTIRGDNNTTNDVNNAAIRRTGADPYIQIIGNDISSFYYGVIGASYWTGGRMSDVQFEGNIFRDCNTGFALGASSGAQTVPLVGNRFINVATPSAAALGGAIAGRIVSRQGDSFIWQTTAAPTLGTWALGDRSVNSAPAVGQPKSWVCTASGTPGIWVSEGNL